MFRRALGYFALLLLLCVAAFSAWIYYGTFGPGGRIDPRFVALLKFTTYEGRRHPPGRVTPEGRAHLDHLVSIFSTVPRPLFGIETKDVTIVAPGGDVPLRIYDPVTEPGDKRTLLVYLHGGGFTVGSIATHDNVCRLLANRTGAVVLSVGYHLAPEFPYPHGLGDGMLALKWAVEHAAELRGNAAKLVVAGDSAGGNLAAALALKARDTGGPKLAYQILIYPVLNLDTFDSDSIKALGDGHYFVSVDSLTAMRNDYLPANQDRKDPYVSPLLAPNLTGLPPALILTAEFDPLRSEGEAYAERLNLQGVSARAHRFPAVGHGFFSMTAIFGQADQALDETRAVLRSNF